MENILLRFCRETRGVTITEIARHMQVTIQEYKDLETGKQLLSRKQAAQLGKLYKVRAIYFYRAAIQLELLLTQGEMINVYKGKAHHKRNK